MLEAALYKTVFSWQFQGHKDNIQSLGYVVSLNSYLKASKH